MSTPCCFSIDDQCARRITGWAFGGLGMLLFAFGAWSGNALPTWLAGIAAAIGLAATALKMGRPDRLSSFAPGFHLFSLWLLATGIFVLRSRTHETA